MSVSICFLIIDVFVFFSTSIYHFCLWYLSFAVSLSPLYSSLSKLCGLPATRLQVVAFNVPRILRDGITCKEI